MPAIKFSPAIVQAAARLPNDKDLLAADYSSLLAVWGNGDAFKGFAMFQAVTMRLMEARAKHPRWEPSAAYGLQVIGSEYEELVRAVRTESENRQLDEALDVIVTALRFYGKEWKE